MINAMGSEVYTDLHRWKSYFMCPYSLHILFFISGYLFFRNISEHYDIKRDYLLKLKSRFSSLLVLWIVYGSLSIAYLFFANRLTISFHDLVLSLSNYDNPRDIRTIGFGMWFIRNLIYFSILSPLYYCALRYLGHFIPFICLLIILCFDLPIQYAHFNAYLLLGAYCSYHGFRLSQLPTFLDWRVSLAAYVLLIVFHAVWGWPLHILVSGVLAFAGFLGLFMKYPISKYIAGGSTFLYASHFLFMTFPRKFFFELLPHSLPFSFLFLVLAWLGTIAIVYSLYFIVCRYRILRYLLTGGR